MEEDDAKWRKAWRRNGDEKSRRKKRPREVRGKPENTDERTESGRKYRVGWTYT